MKYETITESHLGKYWGEYYDSHGVILATESVQIVKK